MKNNFRTLLFLCMSLVLFNCTKVDEISGDVEINDFVWKAMNAYYLYQDQIPDLADRRFNSQPELNNYLRSFTTPNELFLNVLHDRPTTDNKSTLLNDYNLIRSPSIRTSTTHGVEYGIIAEPGSATNVIGYVQYILPNSNASIQNIKRGDFFYAVDNVQLTRSNYNNLLEGASVSFELNMANFNGTIVTPNANNVPLTKTAYTHNSVFMSKNIITGSKNIGYLIYNNDFSSNYLSDVNTTFLQFKSQGVNQLVLDLRYNIGGGSFATNINQIASMITGQFKDQPFIKKRWNSKAQSWFELNQPDSLMINYTDKLYNSTPINSLELTDVYIILNGSSSSIELLINSLKSYINVHIINSQTTDGNNTGSITLYNSIDYDSIGKSTNHTTAVQPIVLEYLNNDENTFVDGFMPDITICPDEDVLNLGVLGTTTDPILKEVIDFVNGIPPNPPRFCNSNNFQHLYNSVRSQQLIDTGVFIKQDLPNTN